MLTPDQLEALRLQASQITDPIVEYLLEDIARRISEAGQLTSTASYQVWRAQNLGMSQREIKKRLKKMLKVSDQELRRLLTQAAEVGYDYDIKRLPQVQAVEFAQNAELQRIVSASVAMAQEELVNITQTLGMVDPYGKALPLRDAYRSCMDFAFESVATGAMDYNTAIRRATKHLAEKGVRTIDYESGVHTSLEAATRRNIMGALGLMVEQTSAVTHDQLGCDGWEISAHANSAPDHEPIQGKQYPDKEYEALNNSLVRRIGTLNCGHIAFPIILGVNRPQYTQEQLDQFRADNKRGVTFEGKHYTGYEATQAQRRMERAIRKQKTRCLLCEAAGDKEGLTTAQIRLQTTRQAYKRFSRGMGLRTEDERLYVAGFGRSEASRATATYKKVAKQSDLLYNTGSEAENIAAWERDRVIRRHIRDDPRRLIVNAEKQGRHLLGPHYIEGRSYLTVPLEVVQDIVDRYAGTGRPIRDRKGSFSNKELVILDREIGVSLDKDTGAETPTDRCYIHYSKTGAHVVPTAKGRETP